MHSTFSDNEDYNWSCRECGSEQKWYDDEIYPPDWTCTPHFGLICEFCSKAHGLIPEEEPWRDL